MNSPVGLAQKLHLLLAGLAVYAGLQKWPVHLKHHVLDCETAWSDTVRRLETVLTPLACLLALSFGPYSVSTKPRSISLAQSVLFGAPRRVLAHLLQGSGSLHLRRPRGRKPISSSTKAACNGSRKDVRVIIFDSTNPQVRF